MPPPPLTAIRSASDLYALWQRLMGRGGFARSSIWIVFLDEGGVVQPVIVPIDDIPPEPDPVAVRGLARVVADALDQFSPGSVALLISRAGPAGMIEADRRWARALHAGFSGLTRWPVHLATYDRIQVFAPDDLIAA